MANLPYAKNLLFYVFAGSRGGENRIKIISALQNSPRNTNQLANDLGLDYRTIQHHLEVLEKNNLITRMGEKYGATYFLSTFFESNLEIYNEIMSKLHKNNGKPRS
ncbi:MAG: winged helix-turn-helix transcriptional regulator [Thaumarchaeota archaeon]|nr:winged helix-turn-helix transcriptional regulator [Nitrososphaerota archaeon]MBI3641734.1 winged helix-turn-helix transcriptional regulator [Nitrososphaerota archaeon]